MSVGRLLPVLIALLLARGLVGQGGGEIVGQRQGLRPTFGRVVDKAGAPIVDAVVTMVGASPHLLPSLQDIHVVEVATDKRGRAMARLEPGLCYLAWAKGRVASGERVYSEAIGYFSAGAMFELVCKQPDDRMTVTLTGAEPWRHLGPLRYFAMTRNPGMAVELTRDQDGAFAWPGYPYVFFEVRLPDDQALWHCRVESQLHLPPPQTVKLRAVDSAGKPLAGAEVQHRVGLLSSWRLDGSRSVGQDRMRRLGVTDAEGRCAVEVPYPSDPLREGVDNLLLFVKAAGRPAVAGGRWHRACYQSDRKVPAFKGDELLFTCGDAGEVMRGALAEAPAGTVAHLTAVCKLFLQRNSYLHDARVFTAEVAADGSFAFDDVPAELHSSRLAFVPPPGSRWQPPVLAALRGRQLPNEVQRREGEEVVAPELVSLELSVIDPGGGPARGAVVLLSSADQRGVLLRDSLLRVPLDERGSARLRLLSGRWAVAAITEGGYGGQVFELTQRNHSVRLDLVPLASMTVVCRDAAGKPIAGARVRKRGTITRGTNNPLDAILESLVARASTRWRFLATDREGMVKIPFVPFQNVEQRVEISWIGGKSDRFTLRGGEEMVLEIAGDGGRR